MTFYALILAAIVPALLNAPHVDVAARRCSLETPPHHRSSSQTVLLATATHDTIAAGTAPTRTRVPKPVHGQLFDVARFAAADSAVLARAFERRGDRRVLMVPWGYGSDCNPVAWSGSFVWVPPAQSGVFAVRLRPDSLWLNGLPVFDVFHAVVEPYPIATAYRSWIAPPSSANPWLSLDEYFRTIMALGTYEDAAKNPESAYAAAAKWETANPDLAARFPANELISGLRRHVEYSRQARAMGAPLPRDSARIVGGEILVEPADIAFTRPRFWNRGFEDILTYKSSPAVYTIPEQLAALKEPPTRWDADFGTVIDGILPFQTIVAFLGVRPAWGAIMEDNFGQLEARVYSSTAEPQTIIESIAFERLPRATQALPGLRVEKLSSGLWKVTRVSWKAAYGTQDTTAILEFYMRTINNRTLAFAFTHNGSKQALSERDEMLSAIRSFVVAPLARPPSAGGAMPDSVVLDRFRSNGRISGTSHRVTRASGRATYRAESTGMPVREESYDVGTEAMALIVKSAEQSSFFELPDKPHEYKALCPEGAFSHTEVLDITWYAAGASKHVTHVASCGGPMLERMISFENLLFQISGKPRQ